MRKSVFLIGLKSILSLGNSKNNEELNNAQIKNLSKGFPLLAAAYLIKDRDLISAKEFIMNNQFIQDINNRIIVNTNQSPLDFISNNIEFLPINGISQVLTLFGSYYILKTLSIKKETPMQDELSEMGSDYCPYNSYVKYKNDLRGKDIQIKINQIKLFSYEFNKNSNRRKIFMNLANACENILEYIEPKYKSIVDFFGKSEKGFTILKHNNKLHENPLLIEHLPINKDLKELLSKSLMDFESDYQYENNNLTLQIRQKAINNAKSEINERNINLLLVKIIDEIKTGNKTKKEYEEEIRKLIELKDKISTVVKKKYVQLSFLTDYIFNELGIDNLEIKNYDKNQKKFERVYHIYRQLDQICYKELKCETLKKPLPYREVYLNETLIAVQKELRGNYLEAAIKNRVTQNNSFLIRDHYINYDKNYDYDNNPIIRKKMIVNIDSDFNLDLTERSKIISKIKGVDGEKLLKKRKKIRGIL